MPGNDHLTEVKACEGLCPRIVWIYCSPKACSVLEKFSLFTSQSSVEKWWKIRNWREAKLKPTREDKLETVVRQQLSKEKRLQIVPNSKTWKLTKNGSGLQILLNFSKVKGTETNDEWLETLISFHKKVMIAQKFAVVFLWPLTNMFSMWLFLAPQVL